MPKQTQPYTFSLMAEAACCLWEALSEWRYSDKQENAATKHFEGSGAVDCRHACIDLAETCCRAWDALDEEEQWGLIPYDWEFCPAFLLCVDWANFDGQPITGAAFDALVARLREASANELKRQREDASNATA